MGGSPRASLALIAGRPGAGGHARAHVRHARGRPQPVHDMLRHRVVLSYEALAADVRPDQVLDAIIDAIPQPDVELGSGRAVG